jgi:4-amino-4-deoxy-L-arabinose transferase-like glycosyltransferase
MTRRSSALTAAMLVPLSWCAILWTMLSALAIWLRPLLTTIETRAMTVAWEMSVRQDYLVPSLNFTPYTQKPPLLAWMINAGWNLFGTYNFVGTVITSLFAFGCIVWTAMLARRWWPYAGHRTQQVIWMSFGAAIFQVYGNVIFYDFILCFFVLMALYMLWQAASLGKLHFFLWYGVCLGFGVLSKGPVILIHIIPVALLAPHWISEQKISWPRWYLSVLGATALGAVLALCWAIPAWVEGGSSYGRWIFIDQTAQRVVKAFDHEQPWWYYFMVTPVLFLPWLFYPKIWQRLSMLKYFKAESPVRFLLCWMISTFVLFSFISGKQLHYVLPLWPAFALLAARLIDHVDPQDKDIKLAFAPFILLALGWVGLTAVMHFHLRPLPVIVTDFLKPDFILAGFYLVAVIALFIIAHKKLKLLPTLSITMALTIAVFIGMGSPQGLNRFSTESLAKAIAQHPNRPLAVVSNRYQGDVNYLARVTTPLTVIPMDNPQKITDYFKAHPKGLVAIQVRSPAELHDYKIVFIQPSRAKRFYALIVRK